MVEAPTAAPVSDVDHGSSLLVEVRGMACLAVCYTPCRGFPNASVDGKSTDLVLRVRHQPFHHFRHALHDGAQQLLALLRRGECREALAALVRHPPEVGRHVDAV